MSGLFRRDWEQLYSGICPGCRTYRFLGHGPLCNDCFTNPDRLARTEAETNGSKG
jgi:hypothetical protein